MPTNPLTPLATLREIATAPPAEVPALVARLETEAEQYIKTVKENLSNAPEIIMTRLVERYPMLAVLQANPLASLVIARIVETLEKGNQK